MQLRASDGAIDLTELQFDIGTGVLSYCRQGTIGIRWINTYRFHISRIEIRNSSRLATTVRHALPSEVLEEVEGHLSTTLNALTIPLDSFFTSGENVPFPHIQEIPSPADLLAISSADLSIKSVRLRFKALDRHYDFQDPQPIQLFLNAGNSYFI